jgi:WD40-like Beta Propeller Repeat
MHGPLSVSPVGEKMLVRMSFTNTLILSLAGAPLDTLGPLSSFDWTETGDRIVDGEDAFIIVYDPATDLYESFPGPAVNNGISWSPLGTGAVYQDADLGLVFMSYPTGTTAAIACTDPDVTDCEGEWPSWSGDADWIAFEDGRQLLRVSPSGGTAEVVVDLPGDITTPAYSPDGKWIVFTRTLQAGEDNLWVTDARGTQFGLVQLTEGAFDDRYPDWSPDGRDVYFISNRSGNSDVWKVAFEAPTPIVTTTWGSVKTRFNVKERTH